MTATIEIQTDLTQCKELWERFSPQEMLWDNWEVIASLFDTNRYKPHFLVVKEEGVATGLLPLQYNKKEKQYEMFGGLLPENRKIWVETKDFPILYENMPTPTSLLDIHQEDAKRLGSLFSLSDYRFYLTPEHMQYDFAQHLQGWEKDKRGNFQADLRKARALGPQIIWSQDDVSEEFIQMNQRRFKEESDYNDENNQQEVKRLVNTLKQKGMLHTLTIRIGGMIEAVCMVAYHNNIFHLIYGASNFSIKNLGKLLYVEAINKANTLRATEINFMVGQGTWKEQWRMEKEACYSLRKT